MKDNGLKKMLASKKNKMDDSSGMDDIEKEAKMSSLMAMKKAMEEMMSGKLDGLKKVTVAAKDQEGLQEGLEKAKELLGKDSSDDESSEDSEESSDESPEEFHEAFDEKKINEKLKKLLKI